MISLLLLQALKARLHSLESASRQLDALRQENAQLRSQLDIKGRSQIVDMDMVSQAKLSINPSWVDS